MTTHKQSWSISSITNAKYLGPIEFQDRAGEWHNFDVLSTRHRLVFGGACNAGFLESGFIQREDGEENSDLLGELLADLETYYNDGPGYVSRVVCNERM
jgi:hypothetical protein